MIIRNMGKLRFICWFLLIILVSMVCTAAYALTDYDYYYSITIRNTSAVDQTTRIPFLSSPESLIAGSYMEADADDGRLTKGGTEDELVSMGLGSNSLYWFTDYISVPAESSQNYTLWTGNTTALARDQEWLGLDTDINYVLDDNSLDIQDKLTISADVDLTALPAAETEIVSKEGNYELAIDAVNWIFRIWLPAAPATEDLSPNGGFTQECWRSGPLGPGPTNYQWVDDAPPLGPGADGTCVFSGGAAPADATDVYEVANTAIPEGSSITGVQVYFRALSTTGNGNFYASLRLGGNTTTAAVQALTNVATNYNTANLARPGGGIWVPSDFNSLRIGIQLDENGGGSVQCYQVFVQVSYTPPDGGHIVTVAAATGSHTLEANYDTVNVGSEQRICVDGGAWTTGVVGGNLHTNREPIDLLELFGKVDDLVINDNAVDVLDYDFESLHICSTVTGTADAGTNITLVDAMLTEKDSYWLGWSLEILTTTDNLAPVGETVAVTDFNAAADRLDFTALTAIVDAGDTYKLSRYGPVSLADADSNATTIVDDTLTEANDYWNGWIVEILKTTDGEAPEGEHSTVTDFVAATDTLTFGALTDTVDTDDIYRLRRLGQIQDQSASENDAFTDLTMFPTGVFSEPGSLITVATPSGIEAEEPEFVGFISSLNYEMADYTVGSGLNIPMYGFLKDSADLMGIDVRFLWIGIAFMLSIAAGVLAWVASGKSIVAVLLAGTVMGIFITIDTGVIPYWSIIVYGIMATALIVYERVYSL